MSFSGDGRSFTITGAKVFTGNAKQPWASSFTVENGKIVAIDKEPQTDATVIDVGGRFISASFGDGHAHPMFGGFEFFGPEIRGKSTVAAIQEAVREYAIENPDLEWIIGGSYDSWIVPNGQFDAKWLDEVVADKAVVLRATDYHTIWCNSKALELSGITAETKDPELGWIMRREDGSPSGTLREWDAVDMVLQNAPAATLVEQVAALELAAEELSSAGITWVQDAWVDPGMPEAYLAAIEQRRLSIRFNLGMRADARSWREQLAWFESSRAKFDGNEFATCNTIKFFADGVIEGHTAAINGGYHDDPHNNGMPCWDWQELREAVAAVDALGFQPHIHAIGDEGLSEALNAIELAQQRNGSKTHQRPVITHVQLLNPAEIERFAALGVVANFEPLWACNDPLQADLTTPHVGELKALWQYPMRSMLAAGAKISMGSDWPVTDYNPLACMEIAITRTVPNDPNSIAWIPEERLDVAQSLTAYTAGVAYQAGEENLWGSIEVGKSADFVVLDKNPFDVLPGLIHEIKVESTWCAGEEIFSRIS